MLERSISKSHLVVEQKIRLEKDAEHGETVFSIDHMNVCTTCCGDFMDCILLGIYMQTLHYIVRLGCEH